MESLPKLLIFFIICSNFKINMAEEVSLVSVLEEKFQNKLSECTNYVAKWLEDFNDRHLGNSEMGRILHYKELKPKFGVGSSRNWYAPLEEPCLCALPSVAVGWLPASVRDITHRGKPALQFAVFSICFYVSSLYGNVSTTKFDSSDLQGKNMKKMGMALLPIVFHVGATSTWMLLTSIMAAKGVAIGLALLVFKIAVSAAKVASFFTTLKAKQSHHEYSWSPPSEHHGYDRSLSDLGSYFPSDWNSYTPEFNDVSPPYKSISMYKHHEPDFEDVEFSEDKKSHS